MADEHKQPISSISELVLWLHHLSAPIAASSPKTGTWERGSGAEAVVTSRTGRLFPSCAAVTQPLEEKPQL